VLHRSEDGLLGLQNADRDHSFIHEHAIPLHPHLLSLADLPHDEGPDTVDERDPGLHEDERPEVRVPAADGASCVDHRGDAGRDELLRGDAIEVLVVDDGDLARPDPAKQLLGPGVDAGYAGGRPSTPADEPECEAA
jgi:hypothetical protein